MCPITPQTAVAIATCEVQVSAADSQTVPTVAAGVSKPLCCRLTLTLTLTSENLSLYTTLLFYKPTINLNLISQRSTCIHTETTRTISCKAWNSPVEYPGEIEIFKSGSSGTFFFCPLSRVIGENSLSSNSHCHMADAKRGGIFKCRLWENYTTLCHDVSEWFLSLAFSSFWYVGLMTFSISHISKWVNILAFLY